MINTTKFKIGDRVVHKRFGAGIIGYIGDYYYTVVFDKEDPNVLHEGGNIDKPNRCWFCDDDRLEPETKKYKFSVGDRVIGHRGYVGVIRIVDESYETSFPYQVYYDAKGYCFWEKEKDLTKIEEPVKYRRVGNTVHSLANVEFVKEKEATCGAMGASFVVGGRRAVIVGGNKASKFSKEWSPDYKCISGLKRLKEYVHILGVYNKEVLRILSVHKNREDAEAKAEKYKNEFGADYSFVVLKEEVK